MNSKAYLLILALLVLAPANMSYGQPTKTEIDEQTGIIVVQQIKIYNEMPEEYRNRVSREEFEKMVKLEPASDIAMEAIRKNAFDQALRHSIRNFEQGVSTFEIISKNKELAHALSVTEKQLDQFKRIQKAYEIEKDEIVDEQMGSARTSALFLLDKKYARKIVKIMFPFQRVELGRWRPTQVGLSKVLTETKIGSFIDLSEKQKEKIRNESQKMADEIQEFIEQKRKEAAELTFDVLNEEQKIKLTTVVSSEQLNKSTNVSIDQLWKFLDYSFADEPYRMNRPKSKEINIWQKHDN